MHLIDYPTTEPVGIPYQTCDVHPFTLQHEWLQNVYE
jgi:hypothetical protein